MSETDDGDRRLDRRTVLTASAGAVSLAALAGCAEQEDDDDAQNETDADSDVPQVTGRPTLPAPTSELNDVDRHVVELLEYQTDLIEEIHDEVY